MEKIIVMNKFLSPFRYPGGKTSIFPFLSSLLEENKLVGSSYAEPYAGGAGLALKLLSNNLVKEIYLNDLDKAIYSVWYCILNYPNELSSWIESIPITLNSWEKCKAIYQNEKEDLLVLGQATLFLNRTNISGVIKGGVIGGKLQQGKYKMDARFNRKNLINKISAIYLLKDRIHLSNLDGIDFIHKLKEDVFIYFDPPYYKKGAELYMNFFNESDHRNLNNVVNLISNKWVISYDNEDFIKNIYSNYNQFIYNLFQSASNKKGKEVIIFSKKIKYNKSISCLNLNMNFE